MAFMPYVGGIIQFITSTADEEDASFDYLRTCYNLLGDMASTYKEGIKPVLLEPSISHFLHIAKMRNCKQRRVTDAVKYARQVGSLMRRSILACRSLTLFLVTIQ
jgi:hypothetical protein